MRSGSFARAYSFSSVVLGSPSTMTKFLGNPHEHLRPLRAALYHHLGIADEVTESIAVWQFESYKVEWKDVKVKPNDDHLEALMQKTTEEIFQIWFPRESQYRIRPQDCSEVDWNNHLNALIGLICEIM